MNKKERASLINWIVHTLEEAKAEEIEVIAVDELTTITDDMIICSGRSTRHVSAIADQLVQEAKARQCAPLGVEGKATGEWVLIDLGDAVVHIMLPAVRGFYQLEAMWRQTAAQS